MTKEYGKPTADRGEASPDRASFHDIQIQRLKRLRPELKTHGCRKAIRKAVCSDLRNMEEEEFNEQFAEIRFVPDAYYINEKELVVYIYEVEVSNPITLDKMHKYVDLMWLLDNEEWGLLVTRVDKHGQPIPLDLFSWETDSVAAQAEKQKSRDKRAGAKSEPRSTPPGWTAEEIERFKSGNWRISDGQEETESKNKHEKKRQSQRIKDQETTGINGLSRG